MAAAPYPPDTRAKGWRFELDYERIVQSSTWALAGAEARPWLLMMWLTAWQQLPCGTLPGDEAVISAMIGAPANVWAKRRAVLMRGWQVADDGLMYHPTISARVLEMIEYRKKAAERVAKHKAAMREQRVGNALPTVPLTVSNDTGTGTGSKTKTEDSHTARVGSRADGEIDPACEVGEAKPTNAGRICRAMKAEGIADPNPGHPDLLALIDAGATDPEFVGAARSASAVGKGFAYAIGTVKRQRIEAAQTAKAVLRGPLPAQSVTVPSTDRQAEAFHAAMNERLATATKPPAAVLALAGRIGR